MSHEAPANPAASAPTVVLPAITSARPCQNCGEPLLGEHCYSCGQPTKGLVRHFSSIIGDFMDSVFELDSRILRTLGPLLLRPGFLSVEYFAGRRVRYVSPVRLFVFLSLFAFFAAQLSFNISGDQGENLIVVDEGDDPARGGAPAGLPSTDTPDDVPGARGSGPAADPPEARADATRSLGRARTVAEVEAIRDAALAEIVEARAETADVPGVDIAMDVAEQGIRNEAERRIEAIRHAEATGDPLPIEQGDDGEFNFNGKPWDPETNPIAIPWLPDVVNRKLNESAGRAKGNIKRIQEDPNLLKDAFLSTVPTTLFVLLPLFALLLKFAYLFKRRLYMEHLIVALHSHSFLCLALLLALLIDALKVWTSGSAWISVPLGWLEVAVIVWMPAYLLLMQKRVYGQGWIMTLLKYGVLGSCYLVLISFGAGISMMVSLVNV